MPRRDIFICFSSKDEEQARSIVRHLEDRGFSCWISSRDVRPGQNYQESIVQAIEAARLILLLFSEFSNKTGEVKKELSLASSFDIPVLPLRLTQTKPNGALLYELATRQWIDAFPDLDSALENVVAAIKEILSTAPVAADAGGEAPEPAPPAPARPMPSRPPERTPARGPIVSAGSAEFEAIRALLARHVGPIAKIFVQKAAADAHSADEFCEKLAGHVNAPADRAAFLRAARSKLSVRS